MIYAEVILFALAIGFQALVSRRVLNAEQFTASQKNAQLSLIWALPLVGATIVYLVHSSDSAPRQPPDRQFASQNDQDIDCHPPSH